VAVSKRLRYEILRRDNHTCRYCGATAPDAKLTVDHVTPTALGGADTPDNLVTACEPCNSGKSSVPADSALVADVAEDAARWATAWRQAAQQQAHESKQKAKTAAKVKARLTRVGKEIYGRPPTIPGDAAASIIRWLELGLPVERINELADYTISRRNITLDSKWRYFSGCCWTALKDLEARTRTILGIQAPTQPEIPGSSLEDHEKTDCLLDAVFCEWFDAWRQAAGRRPTSKEDMEFMPDAHQALMADNARMSTIFLAARIAGAAESCYLSDWLEEAAAADSIDLANNATTAWVSHWESQGGKPTEGEAQLFQRHLSAARRARYLPEAIVEAAAQAGYFRDPQLRRYLASVAEIIAIDEMPWPATPAGTNF
jgi:hypothetical protein